MAFDQTTISDILSRLPVKSITRFKSVSHNWANLTSTPAFVDAHLRRSSFDPSILMRTYNTQTGWDHGIWLFTKPTTQDFQSRSLSDIPLLQSFTQFPKIVGSVNGLVCLDVSPSHGSDFVLWNPATKQFKRLPPPLITSTKSDPIWSVFLGFGFDSLNDDYKLVRIVTFRTEPIGPRVEVYSRRGGVWREIQERFDDAILFAEYGVAADGCLNWAAIRIPEENDVKVVVSFDMATEVFNTIPLPPSARGNVKPMSHSGLLAIAVYPYHGNNAANMNRFEFWVRRNNEHEGQHWHNMFMDYNFPQSVVPTGTWRDREVMIMLMGDGGENHWGLFLFHPANGARQQLPLDCDHFRVQLCTYVESMVSVN